MVSKNNRIQRMEEIADRQSHFGIRKLTIGAASVLLGTTLWLGNGTTIAHAATDNGNESEDGTPQSHEESKAPASQGTENAKSSVIVVNKDNNSSNASASSSSSSSSTASSATAKQSSSSSDTAVAVKPSSSVDTSKLETNKVKDATVVSSSSANKAASSSSSAQSAQKQSSQKAQSNAATNKAAQSASSINKAADTLARDAAVNTAKQTSDSSSINSVKNTLTNVGNAGKTTKNGSNVLSLNLDKAALKGSTSSSQNSNKLIGVSLAQAGGSGDQITPNSEQNGKKSTDNSAATIEALEKETGFKSASDWTTIQNYAKDDSKVNGVIVSGNITANGDLNIDSGKNFTIYGLGKDVKLTLGNNAINNNGNLTLKDLTINGSILGKGKVNVEGTVTSNVDSSNQRTLSKSQLTEQVGDFATKVGANTSNWKAANIEADQVNVAIGAILNVNRSITGDGIVLEDGASRYVADGSAFGKTETANNNGTLNISINANLNINLKDARTATRANEDDSSLDNANSGVRAYNNGHLISGDGAQITINAGHGRAIDFGEPFGGTSSVESPNVSIENVDFGDQYTGKRELKVWYNSRNLKDNKAVLTDTNNSVILGDSTHMNITGRDGLVLGNRANFTTGDHSIIHIDNQGNGSGLLLDNFSSVEVSPQSQLIMTSHGKDSSGGYWGGNYIGLGDNGQFRVEHDATFKYTLLDRNGGNHTPFDDNMNIISRSSDGHPLVYVGPDAIFDGESDYKQYNGEIFAFPLALYGPTHSVFQIDNAKYINWQKYDSTDTGHGNLYYSMDKSLIDATSSDGRTYFVFRWNSKNFNGKNDTFDSSSPDTIKQSIENFESTSSEYWRNAKHLATQYSEAGNTAEFPGHFPTNVDINGDVTPGQKTGLPIGKKNEKWGFDPEDSQRIVLVASVIPTQVDQTGQHAEAHNVQIVYDKNLQPGQVELVQKGQDGLERTTTTTYYKVDASSGKRTLDTTKGKNGVSTTTTILQKAQDEIIHVGPQKATITYHGYGNNTTIPDKTDTDTVTGQPVQTDSQGNVAFVDSENQQITSLKVSDDLSQVEYVDSKGNTIHATKDKDGNYVDSNGKTVDISGITAIPTQIQYNNYTNRYNEYIQTYPHLTVDQWGGPNAKHNYNVTGWTLPAITKAVQNTTEKQVINDALLQNTQNFDVDFTVQQTKTAPVHLTETVSRDIAYKISDGNLTANQQELVDALRSGFDTSKATAAQTHFLNALNSKGDLTQNDLTSDEIKVLNALTEATDDQLNNNGQSIIRKQEVTFSGTGTVDLTTGHLVTVNGQGNITNENGQITWAPTQYAGITAPSMNGHTVMPGAIAVESVLNSKADLGDLKAKGITIPGVSNPTIKQVLDYEANQAAAKAKLPTDKNGNIIYDQMSDPSDYPNIPSIPKNEYIFYQFQLTTNDKSNAENLPVKVTLTVDRPGADQSEVNPSIHVYFTDANTNQLLRSRGTENVTDPLDPNYVIYDGVSPFNSNKYEIQVANFSTNDGNSAVVAVTNGFGLRKIYSNGINSPSKEANRIWGVFKPQIVTQKISYKDKDTGEEIAGYPPVIAEGLTGQVFKVTNDEVPKIIGYELQSSDNPENEPSGIISNYSKGSIHVRMYPENSMDSGRFITEIHKIIDDNGTDQVTVKINGIQQGAPFTIPFMPSNNQGHTLYDGNNRITVHNVYVPQTENVTLLYAKKNSGSYKSADRYFVYTPIKNSSLNIGFYDDTTDSPLTEFNGQNISYSSGDEKPGTAVTGYSAQNILNNLTKNGYVYVDTVNGATPVDISTIPTTIPSTAETFTIHVKHAVTPVTPTNPGKPGQPINPNNPHGPKYPNGVGTTDLTKTATRNINYVYVDDQGNQHNFSDTQLANVPANQRKQTITFNGTAYVDKVTGNLVNVDGQDKDGNYNIVAGSEGKGQITWVATPASQTDKTIGTFAGFTPVQAIDGYNVKIGSPVQSATVSIPTINDNYDVTVVYTKKPNVPTPDEETLTVKYIDDSKQDTQDLSQYNVSITDPAGSNLNYSTKPSIDALVERGFKLVSDGFTKANLGGKMPAKGGNYEVHFIHDIRPVNPDNPSDQYSRKDLTKDVTRTIHYVDKKNSNSLAPDVKQTLHFEGSGTIDKVTGKLVDLNQDGSIKDENGHLTWALTDSKDDKGTFDAVTSPEISGYTIDSVDHDTSKKNVDSLTINHNANNSEVTVYYKENAPVKDRQYAEVNYIDLDENNRQIASSGMLSGDAESQIQYSTTGELTTLKKLGYILVKNNFDPNGTAPKFDNDSSNNQIFQVTLRHAHTPITPDKPGQPGKPVDPKNPNSPNYPDSWVPQDLTKNITRTITYVFTDGKRSANPVIQTVTYEGKGELDLVTGHLVDLNNDGTIKDQAGKIRWTAKNGKDAFDAVPALKNIDGYTVGNVSVNGESKDDIVGTAVKSFKTNQDSDNVLIEIDLNPQNKPVTPTKEKGSVTINVHDDTINKDLDSKQYGYKTGTVDEGTSVNYTNHDSQMKDLTNKGYVIVSDPYADGTVVKTVPGNGDLTYTIHVKHGIRPVNPNNNPGSPVDPNNSNGPKYPNDYQTTDLQKEVTRTIEYVDGNGNQVASSVKSTVNFTGTRYFDEVTGKWTDADGNELKDQSNPTTIWSADQTLKGQKSPVVKGYYLVGVDKSTEQHNDSEDGENVDDVTIDHSASDYTVKVVYNPVANIVPVDPNGNPIPDPNNKGHNVPNTPYTNNPTDPKNVQPDEPVPTIPGYHLEPNQPNPDVNPGSGTVTPSKPGKDTQVVYVPNQTPTADQGTVNVIVHDNTTGKNLPGYNWTSDVDGKPQNVGTKVTYNKQQTITDLENHGYKVINPDVEIPSTITKGTDNVTIYVEHNIIPVNPDNPGKPGQPVNPDNPNGPKYPGNYDATQLTHDVTRTINFVDKSGNRLGTPVEQTVHFTGQGRFDEVTGQWVDENGKPLADQTKGIVWSPDQSIDGLSGQALRKEGYHVISISKDSNGLQSVKGVTLTHSDQNYQVVVTYDKNGKIVPVDSNNNNQPIPDAPQPVLPTDPNDPSKVDNGQKPSVPGYKPQTGKPGDPVEPGQNPSDDVKVPYIKNPQAVPANGTVTYYDQTTGKNIKVDPIKGNVGEKITYTTADQIKKLEDQGYELVSNDFRDGQEVFSKDGNKFVVTLKHATETINPNNPGKPGQPINPNDPNGPKWPDDTGDKSLQVIGKQIVHYVGVDPNDPNAPKDVEHDVYFNHEVVIDKVTGKVLEDHGWTVSTDKDGKNLVNHGDSHDFDAISTPVVDGYVADKKSAGKGTVTHTNPVIEDSVIYQKIGKIVPIDNNGNPIPNAPTPSYYNDPNDPTKVVPDEPVPKIDGYTPNVNTVTPQDPTKDTPVIYTKNPTPVPTPTPEPPTPDKPTPQPPTPNKPTPDKPEPNVPNKPDVPVVPKHHNHKPHHNTPKPSNTHPAAPRPNNPRPAAPRPTAYPGSNVGPHGEYGYNNNIGPHGENNGYNNNIPPIGQSMNNGGNGSNGTNLPNGETIDKNGNILNSKGQIIGYIDKNGKAHYTLPQTGDNQENDTAAAILGGAAVAISMIGLAGVKKRRKRD